jgi:hypothetical protein
MWILRGRFSGVPSRHIHLCKTEPGSVEQAREVARSASAGHRSGAARRTRLASTAAAANLEDARQVHMQRQCHTEDRRKLMLWFSGFERAKHVQVRRAGGRRPEPSRVHRPARPGVSRTRSAHQRVVCALISTGRPGDRAERAGRAHPARDPHAAAASADPPTSTACDPTRVSWDGRSTPVVS